MRQHVPIHATVVCTDGTAGTSQALLIAPTRPHLEHIVVRQRHLPFTRVIVPWTLASWSDTDEIKLMCSVDDVAAMHSFIGITRIDDGLGLVGMRAPMGGLGYAAGDGLSLMPASVPVERLPKGEVAVHRGEKLLAAGRSIGRIEGVVVEDIREISHVVVRPHHVVGPDVLVPVADVTFDRGGPVRTSLDHATFAELPHIQHSRIDDVLGSPGDDLLVPESPSQAGVGSHAPDAAHLEGAHVLADEANERLRMVGFSSPQVLDWAEAYVAASGGGTLNDFVTWIAKQEHPSGR